MYPYRSYVEEPFGDRQSGAFAALVDRVDPACIIPCSEQALYWIWKQPRHIQERSLPNVAPAIRPLLLDRTLLLEAAEASWGVVTPTSMRLDSRDDCLAAIATGLPLMVKSGQSVGSTGVALCHTADEVVRAFDKFSGRPASISAQRDHVGPTYLAGGLFVHGAAIDFYAGEKTMMWRRRRPATHMSCGQRENRTFPPCCRLRKPCARTWSGLVQRRLISYLTRVANSGSSTLIPVCGARPALW